jgi:type VI secretion system protein ImpA
MSLLFSVEALLQPIREDAPAGDSLRYSSAYDAIIDARSADSGLPQGVWQRQEKRADWREVEKLCTAALETKTKDLQIAVWLSEAWLHNRRLPGFVGSLQLLSGLHERFLLTMYPGGQASESLSADVTEHRANLIQTYNERIALGLKFVPLCSPLNRDEIEAHSLADMEKIQYDEQVRRRMNQPKPDTDPFEAIEKGMGSTAQSWFIDLDNLLAEAELTARGLDALLDASYGQQNGGLGEILRVLAAMRQHIFLRLPVPEPPPPPPTDEIRVPFADEQDSGGIFSKVRQLFSGDVTPDVPTNGYDTGALEMTQKLPSESMAPSLVTSGSPTVSGLSGRQEAYERLREIADYLARIEPHSPVPLLLRRAIRWGSLDFNDLLAEMIRSPQGIEEVQELLSLNQNNRT